MIELPIVVALIHERTFTGLQFDDSVVEIKQIIVLNCRLLLRLILLKVILFPFLQVDGR